MLDTSLQAQYLTFAQGEMLYIATSLLLGDASLDLFRKSPQNATLCDTRIQAPPEQLQAGELYSSHDHPTRL